MAHMTDEEKESGDSSAAETLAAETTQDTPRPREGLVIAIAHGFFEVSADDGQRYLCTLRGKLRRTRPAPPPRRAQSLPPRQQRASQRHAAPAVATSETETSFRIAPGDRVQFLPLTGVQGIIEEVFPRRTVLSRARSEVGGEHVMLANLDHAALVFAVREPVPHFGMLDRYLALCEHAGTDVTICLNKVDLGLSPEIEVAQTLYSGIGYRVLLTSATTKVGVDELCARLHDRTSLLSGPSGVGKSSLMNVLLPDAAQRIGEISEATGKGRHTTTGARLLALPNGGWLADSAGIRELALWNVPADELPKTFVELRPVADDCRYEDCDHSEGEEGCALREALAEGRIAPSRFASFERLLQEAREAEQPQW